MSSGTEDDVRAALHGAADHLSPPRLDLDAIRRGGRRRRARGLAAVITVAVVIATGVVTASRLLSVSPPAVTGPARAGPGPAIAGVRAFYAAYGAALRRGPGAVDTLVQARMASWYAPILEVPAAAGAVPPDCGAGASRLRYVPAGLVGGQEVVVAQWSASAQTRYIVVTARPDNGKITGITCTASGGAVTGAGARNAASSLFLPYLHARQHGASEYNSLSALMTGGPEMGSPYLRQLQEAISRGLSYDPVLCSPASVLKVAVGAATVVAGGTAALVVVTPEGGQPFLASVMLGAKGWTVAGIACKQP